MQTGNVNTYIYRFRELKNEIPSMNSAEAYSLFMHGLNPQLRQLAGTMVTSGNLEEVIEIVKKYRRQYMAMKKVDRLKSKLKTNKNGRVEVKVVAREARAIGALVVDQRERPKLLQETLQQEVTAGTIMVVMGGASTSGGKISKPNK